MGKQVTEQNLNDAQKQVIEAHTEATQKGMTTGHEINPFEQQDAAALRPEFLDDEITMLTWTENDLTFFHNVARRPSESTVAQYTVFSRHGEVGPSRFVREIGVAPESQPTLRKKKVDMKYLSDTKNVSLATQLVNNISDPMQIQTSDGIANIAKSIEWASFYGDSDLSDDPDRGSGLQFDGLAKLIDKDNVIDLEGQPLSEQALNYAAVTIAKGFGTPTDAFMPIGVQAEFINNHLQKQTQLTRDNSDNVNLGFRVQGFYSARGFIRLHGSTVMDIENILDDTYIPEPTAPAKPVVTAEVSTNAGGNFQEKHQKAQNYKVVVNTEGGQSAPSDVVSATVANRTDAVSLNIQVNGMHQQRPQYINVYRQGTETDMYYLIERIPASEQDETGNIVFEDKNDNIPETADVFVGEMSPQVVHLFELLPIMRLPLAQLNASVTFSILWYGALALRAPRRFARIKNVESIPVQDVHNFF